MFKIVYKSILISAVAGLLLYLMVQNDWLHFTIIKDAFLKNKKWIFLAVLLYTSLNFVLILRYNRILKNLGIHIDSKSVTSATLVSNAIGQWLPGSLALIEVIRVGLMTGSSKQKNLPKIKSKLAVASLFDRLLGFFTMLFMGSVLCGGVVILSNIHNINQLSSGPIKNISIIGLLSFLVSLIILTLPIIAKNTLFNSLLSWLEKFLSGKNKDKKTVKNIVTQIKELFSFIAQNTKSYKIFTVPALLSFIAIIINCSAIYFCGLATQYTIPFYTIVIAFPIMSLSTLLPINIGGIGGQQIVAASIFQLFALEESNVATANLLAASLYLCVNTLLGLFFARTSSKQIKNIFKRAQ